MSELKNLAPEILEAFDGCDTKEELLAKAAELKVELTDADVDALLSIDEGELDDDDIDEVAGGAGEGDRGWHKGYKRVWRRDDCTIDQWQAAGVPSYTGVKKNGKCGNCEHGRNVNGKLVCVKQYKP